VSLESAIENHEINEEDHFRDDATYRSGRSSLTVDSITGSVPPFAGDDTDEFSLWGSSLFRSRGSFRSLQSDLELQSVGDASPARQVERVQRLKLLKAQPAENGQYELCKEEQERRMLQLARAASRKQELIFSRFDRLVSFCLFHYQHELIKMEEIITQSSGVLEDTAQLRHLRLLLLEYCQLLSFRLSIYSK
jgi:hypothetical protein